MSDGVVAGGLSAGVGRMLIEAREAKGLTREQVADQLKLTVRQVEALEQEQYGILPAMVFVRGFVRNYARLVDLDPMALLGDSSQRPAASETITAPSEGVTFRTSPVKRWLLIPLLLGMLLFLLVAVFYYWLRQGEVALVPSEAGTPPPLSPPQVSTVLPDQPVSVSNLPLVAAPVVSTPQAAPQLPVTPAAPAATGEANPAVSPVQPMAAASQGGAAPLSTSTGDAGQLTFAPSEDSWVQIVDGAGQRYSKLIRAGSTDTFKGTPPFRLVVGAAATVRLEYNGRVVDLTPHIGEKVARLTLE